jgi:hypothetical protein
VSRDPQDGTPGPPDSTPTLADDALLTPFRETDDPVLTTTEVHESVLFGGSLVREGLERLASEGVLERKSVGDGTVWWLPGHTETDELHEPMPGVTYDYEVGLSQHLENAISTLDAPDERERAAVYAVCYYLADRGPATPETLQQEVYSETPAEYDDPDEWWRESIRPALAALPNVECEDGEWQVG